MKKKPEQAVILAGGLGTRLRAITDLRPKPLIEFHGKPFLQYIVEHLRSEGLHDILLLLGYLPEMFQEYFNDGKRFGVKISYSISDLSDDTGRRIKKAESLIDESFFLLYADNYWPFPFDRMWHQYQEMDVSAQLSVYSNKENYTKSNVQVDNGLVLQYDKSRKAVNLQGVEIGFAFFQKSVLDYLGDENCLFETAVYPPLVQEKQLGAFITNHRYYSVGSFDRLPLTDQFLGRRPCVILDRDGVLNKKTHQDRYLAQWSDFEWLPGAKDGLALLRQHGYRIVVVTNQPGIASGLISNSNLQLIHQRMRQSAVLEGGDIDAIYYCPHSRDENCECRKPKPGMLFQAQRELQLDLTRSYFIGDDEREVQAGEAAGCKTLVMRANETLVDVIRQKVLTNEGN